MVLISVLLVTVALVVTVRGWTNRLAHDYASAEHIVEQFGAAAREVVEDPGIPVATRAMIADIAPYIRSARLARSVLGQFEGSPVIIPTAIKSELGPFHGLDANQHHKVAQAFWFFYLALSYADTRYGWRLRRAVLRTEAEARVEPQAARLVPAIRELAISHAA